MLGTRPEAIKLAPVIRALEGRPDVAPVVCSTGQHGHMLGQAMAALELTADLDLAVMEHGQTLAGLTSRLFAAVDPVIDRDRPDWMVVQGDTTTAFVAAMAAFYRGVAVGHVEAGLRTGNRRAPFPEEVNREIVGLVADVHFAPTAGAAANLRREGVREDRIVVTGNTAVDTILWARARVRDTVPPSLPAPLPDVLEGRRLVLVTGHRRESFGAGLRNVCEALRDLTTQFDDVVVVYPVHLNPNVEKPVRAVLAGRPGVVLVEPVDYLAMVWLMDRSHLIITDSGGIQEEAPSLGKPVLITRGATERPEAVEAGCAVRVGTDRNTIVAAAARLLGSAGAYEAMRPRANPFGDGNAGRRIADVLIARGDRPRPG